MMIKYTGVCKKCGHIKNIETDLKIDLNKKENSKCPMCGGEIKYEKILL